MSTMTKVFVVLNSLLSIALAVLFISSASQWGHSRELIERYMAARDAAITQSQNTTAASYASLAMKDEDVAARQASLDQIEAELQHATQQLAQANSELAEAKNARVSLEAGRAKLQEILNVTNGELKTVQKQNQDLLAQNMDLQARNSRLNDRVLELTTNVTILTDELRNVQERLYAAQGGGGSAGRIASAAPLPTGAQRQDTTQVRQAAALGAIRGEITQVDGNYAAINIGESSGVHAGMTFMVYRGSGTYLGDLLVESVRPGEAGGTLSTLAGGQVRSGDRVVSGIQ